MNQEPIKTSSNLPLQEQKKEEWKNILTIIFLALFPLVGLILMWLLASWSKKTKIIITAILGAIIIISIGIVAIMTIININRARTMAKNVNISTRMVELRVHAEHVRWDASPMSYAALCNPNDNTLNEEVSEGLRRIEDAIIDQGGTISCYADADAYCVQVPVIGEANKWHCIDHSGYLDIVTTNVCSAASIRCTP